jgi:hypothetical protein
VLEADVGASSLELALELLDTPAADITSGRHHLDDRWVLIDPVLNFAEMARYTRIKETNPILAQQDQGYRWKRGRFEPYQPTDLAPGQIVMVGYLGHWHDCQMKIPAGLSTPPTYLPVSYTTAHIPFPGGLTTVPATHPNVTSPGRVAPSRTASTRPDLTAHIQASFRNTGPGERPRFWRNKSVRSFPGPIRV